MVKKFEQAQQPFWTNVIMGLLLIMATTGLARVAYGAVLPYMQEGLSLTVSQSGMLGTIMFLGYLLTVGLSGILAFRWGAKAVLLIGGWSVVVSLLGLATANSFWWAALLMLIIGAGSSLVFTPLMSLMISWFPNKRGIVLGFLLSGAGLGMFLSGILVPYIMEQWSDLGWRAVWFVFGLIALLVLILATFILKNPPVTEHNSDDKEKPKWLQNKRLMKIAWLYFAVGIVYLIPNLYQTGFMKEVGISDSVTGTTFAIAGAFSIVGGPIWGIISDRIGSRRALLLAISCAIIGNLVPLFMNNLAGFMISAVIWGSTMGGVLGLIQVSASHEVPQKYISVAIGFISVFYAFGQMIGPGLAGWIIDQMGGYTGAYCFGAFVYCIGLILCFTMKAEQKTTRADGN